MVSGKKALLFVCLSVFIALPKLKAQSADSLTLISIYNATGGPSWSSPWDLTKPVSSWSGVSTDGSGRVTSLNLRSRRLSGGMPAAVGALAALRSLRLDNNTGLSLSLEHLFGLSELRTLTAAKCKINAAIPTGIGALSALRTLHLPSTGLRDPIPPALFTLSQLVSLDLSSNDLSGLIPGNIGSLDKLLYLNFSRNNFEDYLPPQVGGMNKLEELYLQNNGFTGSIPSSFGNLSKLKIMNLASNELESAVPASFQNLKKLQDLNLSKNKLTGELQLWFGKQYALRKFQIQSNKIAGHIPKDMTSVSELRYMDFSDNRIDDEVPESFGTLALLVHLNGSKNLLTGEFYETFGNLVSLQYCNLSNNLFSDNIPETFYFLVSLRHLDLSHNKIGGDIPSKISNLQELEYLNLSHNQLEGAVPGTLGLLKKLTYFNASHNTIWYSISDNITGMKSLTHLNLSNNKLIGRIPVSIGRMTNLQFLDLSFNKLRSTIPKNIQALTKLRNLHLNDNTLEGQIPYALDSLIRLRQLTLQNNAFTDLPPLTHLRELTLLKVENNLLTFEDLEYNVGLFNTFTYSPQAEVALQTPCCLSLEVGGTANRYHWFYENDTVPEADEPVHCAVNPGYYYAEITNDIATELTLRSEEKNIKNTVPQPALKSDTVFCESFELTLDAGEGDVYEWSTGEDTRLITVSEEGVYSVRVEKTVCEAFDTIRVYYKGARNNVVSPAEQVLCAGALPDTLYAGESAPDHSYLWQKSEDLLTWTDLDSALIHLPDTLLRTTYFRRLVNTDSCGIQESNIAVVYVSDAQAEFDIRVPSCSAEADGQISVSISNAFGPFEYRWSTGDTTAVINNIGGGEYTLWVRDTVGCESEFTLSVDAPAPLEVMPKVYPASCNSQAEDASVSLAVSGGTPPFSIRWSNGMDGSEINGLGVHDSIPLTGTVTDANGCTRQVKVFTYRRTAVDASFSYQSDRYCRINPDPYPNITGRAGGTFYAVPYGLMIDSESGFIDLSESEPGEYRLIYEADKCSRDTVMLTLEGACLEQIPNTFSPNNDGANDRWIIPGIDLYPNAKVEIFDRNGRKVFESEPGYPSPWNGRRDGYPLSEGSYFYEIDFRAGKEFKEKHRGYLMLIR